MPSKLLQEGDLNFLELDLSTKTDSKSCASQKNPVTKNCEGQINKGPSNTSQVSWLSLFAELDPLANQNDGTLSTAVDRA